MRVYARDVRAMKPIAQLDESVARALAGVVFDIDDTVTREGRLEKVAFDAMWRLREAGLHLIAATGRPLGVADVVAQHWPVDAAVGENGAGWVWRDSAGRLREGYFADEATRARERILLTRIVDAARLQMPALKLSRDSRQRRCDVAWDIGEEEHESEETIASLLQLIHSEGAKSSVSSVHAHAFTTECDKARGAARAVRDALGRDMTSEMERWLFVGDSGNDAAAFAAFPNSCGVSNVKEHLERLLVRPAYVSSADRGRGFAEIVDVLLSKHSRG